VEDMLKKKREKRVSYAQFTKTEKENIKLTKKYYDKEISIYIDCFNLLARTFDYLARKSIEEEPFGVAETAMLLNTSRVLTSMRVYINLVMKGYYFDATIIERSLWESMLLMECFARDKKYAVKWMNEELKLSKVKKELGLYTDKKFEEVYAEMCDYVHANVPAVLSLTEFAKGKQTVDACMHYIGKKSLNLLHIKCVIIKYPFQYVRNFLVCNF